MPAPPKRARLARSTAYKPSPTQHHHDPSSGSKVLLFSRASIGRLIGGGTGGALAFYLTYLAYGVYTDNQRLAGTHVPTDTSSRYNSTADCFDDDVDFMEWWTGIDRLRKDLCRNAKGHVLEASVGTGRNMEYLPLTRRGVNSIVMVDKSREMIEVARRKWPDIGNAFFIRTTFRVLDLSKEKVPCPSPDGFDTVLQTMGICSTGQPEETLRNLAEMTKPDTGRILLLEHGRSHYSLVNWFLDYTAKAHAHRHGCWYNKDIGDIVRRSGLEIVEEKRFDLGTTYWYILKPAPKSVEAPQNAASDKGVAGSSWFGWLT